MSIPSALLVEEIKLNGFFAQATTVGNHSMIGYGHKINENDKQAFFNGKCISPSMAEKLLHQDLLFYFEELCRKSAGFRHVVNACGDALILKNSALETRYQLLKKHTSKMQAPKIYAQKTQSPKTQILMSPNDTAISNGVNSTSTTVTAHRGFAPHGLIPQGFLPQGLVNKRLAHKKLACGDLVHQVCTAQVFVNGSVADKGLADRNFVYGGFDPLEQDAEINAPNIETITELNARYFAEYAQSSQDTPSAVSAHKVSGNTVSGHAVSGNTLSGQNAYAASIRYQSPFGSVLEYKKKNASCAHTQDQNAFHSLAPCNTSDKSKKYMPSRAHSSESKQYITHMPIKSSSEKKCSQTRFPEIGSSKISSEDTQPFNVENSDTQQLHSCVSSAGTQNNLGRRKNSRTQEVSLAYTAKENALVRVDTILFLAHYLGLKRVLQIPHFLSALATEEYKLAAGAMLIHTYAKPLGSLPIIWARRLRSGMHVLNLEENFLDPEDQIAEAKADKQEFMEQESVQDDDYFCAHYTEYAEHADISDYCLMDT